MKYEVEMVTNQGDFMFVVKRDGIFFASADIKAFAEEIVRALELAEKPQDVAEPGEFTVRELIDNSGSTWAVYRKDKYITETLSRKEAEDRIREIEEKELQEKMRRPGVGLFEIEEGMTPDVIVQLERGLAERLVRGEGELIGAMRKVVATMLKQRFAELSEERV